MTTPILATKLYIPSLRPQVVRRSRLTERLNEGLHGKLTLISAPAGSGKTTLVSEWIAACGQRIAWLSLDEADSDPTRFLTYFVAALQTISAGVGDGITGMLQSPQPPSPEHLLTTLLNDIATIADNFILILDDYHALESTGVDQALTFLLEHLPPQMHVVIATREDPQLPLARLRARGQLTELRAGDLRFTLDEAAGFLNSLMGLNLSVQDIAALEARTEGWIAGLHLAALALQGDRDTTGFINSFTGSHHFVMDYLIEEVLRQQPESIQAFLLHTSILDRLCGSLCDAVVGKASSGGQAMLEHLERANLFLIPLDDERHWYRYHHLFGDLLRQRLPQSFAASKEDAQSRINALHIRASEWYQAHGLPIEAFQHAAAANDIERTTRLIEGDGMPLHFRGGVGAVLGWLESQPKAVLDARPLLWVIYASALLFVGQMNSVEAKVQAAEAALQGVEQDETIRDVIGHIASIRATLAVNQFQAEAVIAQSHRALDYLHPHNLPVRTATTWTLGFAYHLQGDRVAATRAYTEAIAISEAIGHHIILIGATIGLGMMQEANTDLHLAAESYQRVIQLAGNAPMPITSEAHLGLARLFYEWNDLDAAEHHGRQSLRLVKRIENSDRVVSSEVFLARLKLAQGDVPGAAAHLAQASQLARQNNFVMRLAELTEAQVLLALRKGDFASAAHLAQGHDLPLSQARVRLVQGDPSAALMILEAFRQQMETRGWREEWLRGTVLQAIALYEQGDKGRAVQLIGEALALAEPSGFIRLFADEGLPMARLLSEAAAHAARPDYIHKLLAACDIPSDQPEIDALSQRELEILRLIAQGLSNQEIGERLFLALSTVKGHTQRIFDKLQVQRRTEAVARARDLNLL